MMSANCCGTWLQPELRALAVRMDNLDRRLDSVEKQIAEMRGELRAEIKNGVQYIVSQLQLISVLASWRKKTSGANSYPKSSSATAPPPCRVLIFGECQSTFRDPFWL